MVRVIAVRNWFEWCDRRKIDPAAAHFATESCYYGKGFRARPGVLFVTQQSIIHHSYDSKATAWAIGEREQRVEIPAASLRRVRRQDMGFGFRLLFLFPEAHFELEAEGRIHHLVFQRDAEPFAAVLVALGIDADTWGPARLESL